MQASKIVPSQVYAIYKDVKDRSKGLLPFQVQSVTTTRSKGTGSPHDYSSTVTGWVTGDDAPRNDDGGFVTVTLHPDRILGPFQDFKELVERQAAERADKARKEKEKQDARLDTWRALYKKLGLVTPNDPHDWSGPIRLNHGSDFTISDEMALQIVAALPER